MISQKINKGYKMNEFQKFVKELHSTEPQPNQHYYKLLVDNAKLIVMETALRQQHFVAEDLRMNRMKLNHLLPLLKEFAANDYKVIDSRASNANNDDR